MALRIDPPLPPSNPPLSTPPRLAGMGCTWMRPSGLTPPPLQPTPFGRYRVHMDVALSVDLALSGKLPYTQVAACPSFCRPLPFPLPQQAGHLPDTALCVWQHYQHVTPEESLAHC